jgi:2-oxo-4-hydroxy-4-carboxy-5-ureidoimidazoline decarboxylase
MAAEGDEAAGRVAVARFDGLPLADAEVLLRPCCASSHWIDGLVAGRPYANLTVLAAASDQLIAALDPAGLDEALAAHPRIGERVAGAAREASWSRQEQAATADADGDVQERLRAGNVAYEQRFGQVFLICATGRTARQLLDALVDRLANSPEDERERVRAELRDIVRLRLAKAFR